MSVRLATSWSVAIAVLSCSGQTDPDTSAPEQTSAGMGMYGLTFQSPLNELLGAIGAPPVIGRGPCSSSANLYRLNTSTDELVGYQTVKVPLVQCLTTPVTLKVLPRSVSSLTLTYVTGKLYSLEFEYGQDVRHEAIGGLNHYFGKGRECDLRVRLMLERLADYRTASICWTHRGAAAALLPLDKGITVIAVDRTMEPNIDRMEGAVYAPHTAPAVVQ